MTTPAGPRERPRPDPAAPGPASGTGGDRLLSRTCAWCGTPVPYGGTGRPPKFCSSNHRNRAYTLRTAQARSERPVTEGGRNPEPVREVVERLVPAFPTTAAQWHAALAELARQGRNGRHTPRELAELANTATRLATALRTRTPPGPGSPSAP
ncbi:hypothetical protein ACN20G_27345 (plasmid) [Streptomyces sp. BI20]|uniref:hypothetical protein n=1 Tax=Streptomyces sp. BI20 TaxID=3403460 RepID=UPI003C73E87C